MTVRHTLLSACSVLVACALLTQSAAAQRGGGPPPPKPECKLDTLTITCIAQTASSITLHVCAGPSGAPGGVSIQWVTCADYLAFGGVSSSASSYAAISLSGVCKGSLWNLGPNGCRDITINAFTVALESALTCGVSGTSYDLNCDPGCYVFRGFAHNDPHDPNNCKDSDKNVGVECHTAACPTGECTLTWGYWKTHGPEGCNPPHKDDLWPVSSLVIGTGDDALDKAALCAILQTNPGACAKGGSSNGGANAVKILEHQLIAAMLNVANNAVTCGIQTTIDDAKDLLTGKEDACVGASTPDGQAMIALASLLEAYNSDKCDCSVQPTKPQASPAAPGNATHKSWGQLKSIYR